MIYASFYPKGLSEIELLQLVREDGFDPYKITDGPGYVYQPHSHPETKEIVCLKGSMVVEVENHKFPFNPGDKIVIPGGVIHSAIVGERGCTYLWSEKI